MSMRGGAMYYDKVVWAQSWEDAQQMCGRNEMVHGKFVEEIPCDTIDIFVTTKLN